MQVGIEELPVKEYKATLDEVARATNPEQTTVLLRKLESLHKQLTEERSTERAHLDTLRNLKATDIDREYREEEIENINDFIFNLII